MLRIKILQRSKKCQIFNFRAPQYGHRGQKNSCFLARPENSFKSKQTYFSYGLDKGFLIFHAKLRGRFLLRLPLKALKTSKFFFVYSFV